MKARTHKIIAGCVERQAKAMRVLARNKNFRVDKETHALLMDILEEGHGILQALKEEANATN